jgi:hypothetical protein
VKQLVKPDGASLFNTTSSAPLGAVSQHKRRRAVMIGDRS